MKTLFALLSLLTILLPPLNLDASEIVNITSISLPDSIVVEYDLGKCRPGHGEYEGCR